MAKPAELAILRVLLDSPEVLHNDLLGVTPEHFTASNTQLAFELLTSKQHATEEWLRQTLRERGHGLPELPSVAGAELKTHYEVLTNAWIYREIERAYSTTAKLGAASRLSALHSRLDAIIKTIPGAGRTTAAVVDDYLKAVRARPADFRVGISTRLGLESFCPGGIPIDKLSIVFAQTGHLKSTTGLNLLTHAAEQGDRVVYFSLEDSEELVGQAILSQVTGVPLSRIYTQDLLPAEISRIERAPSWLSNIIIESDIPKSMAEVVSRVRRHHAQSPVSMVLVDYAQLFDFSGPEREALGDIAKTAREAAHQDRIAYVLLSQVNESKMRERKDYRPQLDDIFGSSVIKQCAKLAFGLYRPSVHQPERDEESEWLDLSEKQYESLVELWVRKNKLGNLGRLLCQVDLPTGRMSTHAVAAASTASQF